MTSVVGGGGVDVHNHGLIELHISMGLVVEPSNEEWLFMFR